MLSTHAAASRWCDLALVLAPNAALCRQVVAAADSLVGPDGRPLVTAAHLSSATPPPYHAVDLAVSTPGLFSSLLVTFERYRHGQVHLKGA